MKQKATKSTKDRLKELEIAVQNSVMAVQMQQMMVKHLTNQVSLVLHFILGPYLTLPYMHINDNVVIRHM